MPLSAITGIATSILASPEPGWSSVMKAIQDGWFEGAAQSFIASWTGVKLGGIGGQTNTEFNMMEALNPFDLTHAPAWKTMMWTHLGTMVTKKIAKQDPFKRLPLIGKWISFS